MALILVVLLGVVGFAVDLGWAYWNSIEIQHGAESQAASAQMVGNYGGDVKKGAVYGR